MQILGSIGGVEADKPTTCSSADGDANSTSTTSSFLSSVVRNESNITGVKLEGLSRGWSSLGGGSSNFKFKVQSSYFCGGLQKMHLFCNRVRIGHSRLSKVTDFGTNQKGVCVFLLVINRNFGPILHRF